MKIRIFAINILVLIFFSCSKSDSEITDENTRSLPDIETLDVSQVTESSATLGGNIVDNGNALIVKKGVCWSISANPTLSDNIAESNSTSPTFTLTIETLQENTLYYVRAFATNSEGTSYGNEISFTTEKKTTIFNGDVVLESQAEVDDFGKNSYQEITGKLIIQKYDSDNFVNLPTDITNLDALSKLRKVGSHIFIIENDDLTSIDGLNNITTIGGSLEIFYNDAISGLLNFNNLTSISGSIRIVDNDGITEINGFNNLAHYSGGLQFSLNDNLTLVSGFEKLTSCRRLLVTDNALLDNINFLQELTSVQEDVQISDNPNLKNLNGFISLSSIGSELKISSNSNLTDIDGLVSLVSIQGSLTIFDNANLTSISGLNNISSELNFLNIFSNNSLSSITGLNGIENIKFIDIENNELLQEIIGLQKLSSVENRLNINSNSKLTILDGFAELQNIGGNLNIESNIELRNFCPLTSAIVNGISGTYNIINNGYNPSIQDIIDGKCTN